MNTDRTNLRKRPRKHPRRRAMSTVELALSIAVIGALLASLVLVSNSVREQSAREQTLNSLHKLRLALDAYHTSHHAYPAGPAHAGLATLLANPASRTYVQSQLPQPDDRGRLKIPDGYGRPLHYVHGDFVSAGADGRLGHSEQDADDIADNLYGADTRGAGP